MSKAIIAVNFIEKFYKIESKANVIKRLLT